MTGAKESEPSGTTREGFSSQVFEDDLAVDERSSAAADVRLWTEERERERAASKSYSVVGSNGRNVHRVLFTCQQE